MPPWTCCSQSLASVVTGICRSTISMSWARRLAAWAGENVDQPLALGAS